MKTAKRALLAAALAGGTLMAAMSANAFWCWDDWGPGWGGWGPGWGGGPWGWGGYPYYGGYPGWGYPGWGGYPYYGGYPGWGYPAWGYAPLAYPYAAPAAAAPSAPAEKK